MRGRNLFYQNFSSINTASVYISINLQNRKGTICTDPTNNDKTIWEFSMLSDIIAVAIHLNLTSVENGHRYVSVEEKDYI